MYEKCSDGLTKGLDDEVRTPPSYGLSTGTDAEIGIGAITEDM